MEKIKVIIIDDHPSVRFGLQALLNKYHDIHVVGVGANGAMALKLCQEKLPDVVIIDLSMPGMSGFDVIRIICAEFPRIKTLVLTNTDYDRNVFEAINAGASGYLVKDAEIETIIETIRSINQGKNALTEEAQNALFSAQQSIILRENEAFTDREIEVLELLVNGKSNAEIADMLIISISTVKYHLRSIFRKLDVKTRTEAVLLALQLGLVSNPEH